MSESNEVKFLKEKYPALWITNGSHARISLVQAMGEYALLKVAESESKNLNQANVIKSVCEKCGGTGWYKEIGGYYDVKCDLHE